MKNSQKVKDEKKIKTNSIKVTEQLEKEKKSQNFTNGDHSNTRTPMPREDKNIKESEKADVNLYLDFFEFYNQNDFEECLKILNTILKIEPNNRKVLEMHELIEKEIETERKQDNIQDISRDNIDGIILNKNMKMNKDGEYYYSDCDGEEEEYDEESENDKE